MLSWMHQNRVLLAIATFIICVEAATLSAVQHDDEMRIVGGQTAKDVYPYMVSLQVTVPDGKFHNCGASILNSLYVLTAAHCVDKANSSQLSIVVGTNDLASKEGQEYPVESYLIHEDYIELNRSDIAIIKLAAPIQFNDKVQPVVLDTSVVGGGVKCLLTGWGFRFPIRIGGTPKKLQRAEFQTITNTECNQIFPAGPTEICIRDHVFKGACGGDSGGPLVDAKSQQQIGLTSYGFQVCGAGLPDVFTRISMFLDWIAEHSKEA